jgi:outer membrane murein-binding lipoprotein Lpp
MGITIQGVAATPDQGPQPGSGGAGALLTQLAQVQAQLADCIHCDTANTPSGQAKIQLLSARVQVLKARVDEVEANKRNQQSAPASRPTSAEAGRPVAAPAGGAVSSLDLLA